MYYVDYGSNFMDPGPSYNQISLTDACTPDGACDLNPVYGYPNDNDEAISYCKSVCTEKVDNGE